MRFSQLKDEYTQRLTKVVINSDQLAACIARVKVILPRARAADPDSKVEATLGLPLLWWLPSFERESSSDFSTNPAQGDKWNKRSTHVPSGMGPYSSWLESALAAYRLDGLDKVGIENYTWEMATYQWELFNGFGPRNHGRVSGYPWSWTNQYNGGKYVSDGQWSSSAVDVQCGTVALAMVLTQLDPTVKFANPFPGILPDVG